MKQSLDRRTVIAGMAAVAVTTVGARASGATHTVQMLNEHPEDSKIRHVYVPRILVVEPGDTIVFENTHKGHNTESMKGMIPEGAESWKSQISKEFTVSLDQPGVYGYKCTPHMATGMVGLIIVKGDGMMDNVEAAKAVKQRGKSKKVWEEIWAEVDSENLLT